MAFLSSVSPSRESLNLRVVLGTPELQQESLDHIKCVFL